MDHLADKEWSIDGTVFQFPKSWKITKFDEWPQFSKPAGELGLKGCDVLAIDDDTLWIIEMKDYTYLDAKRPVNLPQQIAMKAVGTMSTLYSLERAQADSAAAEFARKCSGTRSINLALHIDVKDGGRKGKQIGPALMSLKSQLTKTGKALGIGKTYITSTLEPAKNTPWHAKRDPSTRSRHMDR